MFHLHAIVRPLDAKTIRGDPVQMACRRTLQAHSRQAQMASSSKYQTDESTRSENACPHVCKKSSVLMCQASLALNLEHLSVGIWHPCFLESSIEPTRCRFNRRYTWAFQESRQRTARLDRMMTRNTLSYVGMSMVSANGAIRHIRRDSTDVRIYARQRLTQRMLMPVP